MKGRYVMDKAFVKSVSDKLGYTLLGEYAKGVAESKGIFLRLILVKN